MKKHVIVKIGGYYIYNKELAEKIVDLAEEYKFIPIFVCGGGIFANSVREAYIAHSFSSKTAHYAAIKAMEISALIFSENIVNGVLTDSLDDIFIYSVEGKYPIILPYKIVLRTNILPETWEITGDSVASLIAVLLGVKNVVFVKKVPNLKSYYEDACKFVDKYSCKMVRKYGLRALIVNGDNLVSVASGFASV